MPEPDPQSPFDRDYPWLDAEGDCITCDGTGEVICTAPGCEGSGCRRCIDGCVTCPECDGSGYNPDRDDRDEMRQWAERSRALREDLIFPPREETLPDAKD